VTTCKLQAQDNFSYTFGKHDMKWGGDVNVFQDRKDVFAGWSAGSYSFGSLARFRRHSRHHREQYQQQLWCAALARLASSRALG